MAGRHISGWYAIILVTHVPIQLKMSFIIQPFSKANELVINVKLADWKLQVLLFMTLSFHVSFSTTYNSWKITENTEWSNALYRCIMWCKQEAQLVLETLTSQWNEDNRLKIARSRGKLWRTRYRFTLDIVNSTCTFRLMILVQGTKQFIPVFIIRKE